MQTEIKNPPRGGYFILDSSASGSQFKVMVFLHYRSGGGCADTGILAPQSLIESGGIQGKRRIEKFINENFSILEKEQIYSAFNKL